MPPKNFWELFFSGQSMVSASMFTKDSFSTIENSYSRKIRLRIHPVEETSLKCTSIAQISVLMDAKILLTVHMSNTS
jgi:hypothetical protein